MKKVFLLVAAMSLLVPFAAHAGKSNEVVVEINTSKGVTPITLVRKGEGFVGPRGEYYPSFPTKKTLSAVYGSSTPAQPTPKPSGSSGAVTGDITAKQVAGGVNILRNGKLFREIRTKFPEVRGWKFEKENTRIVVKSGIGREPSLVELFDVKSGQLLEKIKAASVKDGKPAWAKNFAE